MKLTSKEDLKKLNSRITLEWIKVLSPALFLTILLSFEVYERFNFLDSLKSNDLFICKDDTLVSIQIDKKDGWILKDGYFIKGNDKVSQEICKTIKKNKDKKIKQSNNTNISQSKNKKSKEK